jgi:hypothetical protein
MDIRDKAMRYYLNRAIAQIVGGDPRKTDYYFITKAFKENDGDGSFDAILEYYIDACVGMSVVMYETKQTVSDEEFVAILVQSFMNNGVDQHLIAYFAED